MGQVCDVFVTYLLSERFGKRDSSSMAPGLRLDSRGRRAPAAGHDSKPWQPEEGRATTRAAAALLKVKPLVLAHAISPVTQRTERPRPATSERSRMGRSQRLLFRQTRVQERCQALHWRWTKSLAPPQSVHRGRRRPDNLQRSCHCKLGRPCGKRYCSVGTSTCASDALARTGTQGRRRLGYEDTQ